tara:strand:+ start:274 stop:870 length:597 start_codon:yes stop_codon:yes gene_type:complete
MSSKKIKMTIANLAARMIMEEGVKDYFFAKKKAARSLGFNEEVNLPTNMQIDKAIEEFHKIFNQDIGNDFLEHFKTQALNVMDMFKNFRPHLMNKLSEGIIPKFPEIKINLFADNLKDIEYILLNSEITYEFSETKTNKKVGKNSIKSVPTIYLDSHPIPTEVKVYFENDFFNFKKNFLQNRGMDYQKVLNLNIKSLI